jgi:hypothetical protein
VPAPPAAAATIDVFLTPTATATGITLSVKDTALQPIAHVRVDAFALEDGAGSSANAWHVGPALWQRRADDSEGRYVLPPLSPGSYGIRLTATDEQGELLPLLPFRHTYELTGSNGFVEDVVLEPACLPLLQLVALDGTAIEPDRLGDVRVSLRTLGAPDVSRKWLVRPGDDPARAPIAAIDRLPGAGTTWPAEAVPAGTYTFEVHVDGQLRFSQPLALPSGQRHRERIVVP